VQQTYVKPDESVGAAGMVKYEEALMKSLTKGDGE
jgi:hypothetical protein